MDNTDINLILNQIYKELFFTTLSITQLLSRNILIFIELPYIKYYELSIYSICVHY